MRKSVGEGEGGKNLDGWMFGLVDIRKFYACVLVFQSALSYNTTYTTHAGSRNMRMMMMALAKWYGISI